MAPISPLSSLQVPASRCSTSSFERTGFPSIQAHGGQLAKAKRFADNAQDLTYSSWRGGGSSNDAARGSAAHYARGRNRQSGGSGYVPPAQSVWRRVRARARRLRRETRRRKTDRNRDQRNARRPRSALELHGLQELPRHASADARRVRRSRH